MSMWPPDHRSACGAPMTSQVTWFAAVGRRGPADGGLVEVMQGGHAVLHRLDGGCGAVDEEGVRQRGRRRPRRWRGSR